MNEFDSTDILARIVLSKNIVPNHRIGSDYINITTFDENNKRFVEFKKQVLPVWERVGLEYVEDDISVTLCPLKNDKQLQGIMKLIEENIHLPDMFPTNQVTFNCNIYELKSIGKHYIFEDLAESKELNLMFPNSNFEISSSFYLNVSYMSDEDFGIYSGILGGLRGEYRKMTDNRHNLDLSQALDNYSNFKAFMEFIQLFKLANITEKMCLYLPLDDKRLLQLFRRYLNDT